MVETSTYLDTYLTRDVTTYLKILHRDNNFCTEATVRCFQSFKV